MINWRCAWNVGFHCFGGRKQDLGTFSCSNVDNTSELNLTCRFMQSPRLQTGFALNVLQQSFPTSALNLTCLFTSSQVCPPRIASNNNNNKDTFRTSGQKRSTLTIEYKNGTIHPWYTCPSLNNTPFQQCACCTLSFSSAQACPSPTDPTRLKNLASHNLRL